MYMTARACVRSYVCMYVSMYVCMYIYMYQSDVGVCVCMGGGAWEC